MIPLRSEKRFGTRPFAVWLMVALCIAALVRLALLPNDRAISIINALAVVPQRLLSDPWGSGQVLTLVTSTFLHAGWVHLLFNMLFLVVFGPTVQFHLGWKYFMVFYLLCGAAGSVVFSLGNQDSVSPLLGASGAIAGVLGAHLLLEPRARITTLVPVLVIFEVASLPAAFVIAVWFALQVASTLAPVAPEAVDSGVAWTAHIGGFIAGMVLASPAAVRNAWDRHRKRALARGRTRAQR